MIINTRLAQVWLWWMTQSIINNINYKRKWLPVWHKYSVHHQETQATDRFLLVHLLKWAPLKPRRLHPLPIATEYQKCFYEWKLSIYLHSIQYGKTYDSLKSIRFFFMFSHLKLTVHTSKSMSVGLGAGGREGARSTRTRTRSRRCRRRPPPPPPRSGRRGSARRARWCRTSARGAAPRACLPQQHCLSHLPLQCSSMSNLTLTQLIAMLFLLLDK